MEATINQIQTALMNGNAQLVKAKAEKALDLGMNPRVIIEEGLLPAINVIGQKFRDQKISIIEVLMASRAMHAGLFVLRPLLTDNNSLSFKGRIVIGTVAGDLHDLGKNMVAMMLEGAGYEVIDLGIDVTSTDFVDAVRKYEPDILGMSSLLTTTMSEFLKIITLLREENLRDKVKVLVGGGPVTSEFAMAIGADGFASDAYSVVSVADRLTQGESGVF